MLKPRKELSLYIDTNQCTGIYNKQNELLANSFYLKAFFCLLISCFMKVYSFDIYF